MRSARLALLVTLSLCGCIDLIAERVDPFAAYDTAGMELAAETEHIRYFAYPGSTAWDRMPFIVEREPLALQKLHSVPGLLPGDFRVVDVFLHPPIDASYSGRGLGGAAVDGVVHIEFYTVSFIDRTLSHELTHIVANEGLPFTRSFLSEAVAVYVENSVQNPLETEESLYDSLSNRLTQWGYIPLIDLTSESRWFDDDVRLAYIESGVFCAEVARLIGWEGFWRLYRDPRIPSATAAELNDILRSVTGLSFSDFDRRIEERLESWQEHWEE